MRLIRIYYSLDDIYEGPVETIPSPVGVVAIAVPDCRGSAFEMGRLVLHSAEYYVCINGDWFPLQTVVDLVDHVLYSKPECVLKGRWVPNEQYEVIVKRAWNDPGFPRKSGENRVRETGAL